MRLFAALLLPEPVIAAVCAHLPSLKRDLPAARWVRLEGLHLTLTFVGEVDEDRAAALASALAPAFAAAPPLILELMGGGTFPPRRSPRALWLALTGVSEDHHRELLALAGRVAEAVSTVTGTPPEARPFHPHVTLARVRESWPAAARERFLVLTARSFGEPFEVKAGVLMESELGAGGSRYRAVASFPLRGADCGKLRASRQPEIRAEKGRLA